MEEKGFFKTKAGGLTIAFLVIIFAFILMAVGLQMDSDLLCTVGLVLIGAAMLYSPVKVFIIDRKQSK